MLYLAIYNAFEDNSQIYVTFYASTDSEAEYKAVHVERPAGASTRYVARVIAN